LFYQKKEQEGMMIGPLVGRKGRIVKEEPSWSQGRKTAKEVAPDDSWCLE